MLARCYEGAAGGGDVREVRGREDPQMRQKEEGKELLFPLMAAGEEEEEEEEGEGL